MKSCPQCGQKNLNTATACDCGFQFLQASASTLPSVVAAVPPQALAPISPPRPGRVPVYAVLTPILVAESLAMRIYFGHMAGDIIMDSASALGYAGLPFLFCGVASIFIFIFFRRITWQAHLAILLVIANIIYALAFLGEQVQKRERGSTEILPDRCAMANYFSPGKDCS
jgi:hypothetical protein